MMEGQRAMVVFSSQTPLPPISHCLPAPPPHSEQQIKRSVGEEGIAAAFPSVTSILSPLPLKETFPFSKTTTTTTTTTCSTDSLPLPTISLDATELASPSSSSHAPSTAAFAAGVCTAAVAGIGGVVSANGGAGVGVGCGETEAEVEEEKKSEKEHKKRSKNWTRPETLKLIRLRTDLDHRFAKTGRKTELWDEIADCLQKERFCRDAQQCRDKWEKLTAGYKEVRDGLKDREDNPFYDELYPLLSGKSLKRDKTGAIINRDREKEIFGGSSGGGGGLDYCAEASAGQEMLFKDGGVCGGGDGGGGGGKDEEEEETPMKKRKKGGGVGKYIAVTDLVAVQNLLEAVIAKQQKFFREMLEAMERKEQIREQIRQEKEDKWRAEERAQRLVLNNAMVVLTQKLVGDKIGVPADCLMMPQQPGSPDGGGGGGGGGGGQGGPKKRSKNWKRTEVLQLIKLRGDMENKFAKSTRRAALWDEVADLLKAQGIKRDGKQCREKWDKLMAEYKDVSDGKREQGESHYFAELTAILTKPTAVAAATATATATATAATTAEPVLVLS